MAEQKLNARIVHKHDVEANWLLATGFTPKQGEIIVYDIDDTYNYERFKIGDGINNVNDLPFATDGFISYTEQSLDDEQRAQARRNIGADGLDWHETEPGSAYTTYIANVGINNGITDWDKALSIKGGASGDQAVLDKVARSVASLLDGSSKSINKANFVNLFLSNIGVLVDSGCITLPWGFAFAVNETARKVGKISYCKVQSQSNGIWALFNLENNKYFMIKADGTYIDNTAVYPDDTLTKSGRAADAKAVGDALALKIDKSDIATDDEILEMLAQEDMLPVVADSDGALLSDENENILLW